MRYIDFVDSNYIPSQSDLICEFYVEPDGISLDEAAGGVAAESSIGTWTELSTMKRYVERLQAKVFQIKGNIVQIAYPEELFEEGNVPNMLSSIAGNVFGLKTLKNLRLNDITIPFKLAASFMGPKYGTDGIREILKVKSRPLIGTIIKPKLGLSSDDHAQVAYEAWLGGCDLVKDDENLSNQSFNSFNQRLVKTLNKRDAAENKTGERKAYIINITAETGEMLRRARMVSDHGGEYAMVDILTCGYSSLQTLRSANLDLIFHAHRAGHATFTKNPKHGISMKVISKIIRLIGLDQLHVGTVVGKMFETREDVLENRVALQGEMYGLKTVLPVASGGIHPLLIPDLIELFGKDFAVQAGGGIHGHKNGTTAGAKAMRQAVDAVLEGKTLQEYALTHGELMVALEIWRPWSF